jgi:hypothetical protein
MFLHPETWLARHYAVPSLHKASLTASGNGTMLDATWHEHYIKYLAYFTSLEDPQIILQLQSYCTQLT